MTDRNPTSREAGVCTPAFASIVLACLGGIDLVRGVLHTFLVEHSAVKIAGLDLAHSGQDQLLLLGSFGISNFLTGALFIAVALKAKQLVPTVLAIIPAAYLLGLIAFRLNHITPEAAFPGRTFMLAYSSICVLTFLASVVCMRKNLKSQKMSLCPK
ncbi:MAG: hypothetical protein K8T91_15840 [Planctomycetes bacterium]|nr:hypothetical protein [Planctomycetota bacterium]